MDSVPDSAKELELELYAGLKVLQEKQSEINRRVGRMELSMESVASLGGRVGILESTCGELNTWKDEGKNSKRAWGSWAIQTIGSVVLTALTIWIGTRLGVPLDAH